ncbi:MAG: quinol dehydrogenase ferredoxin subunit NapH [bacterium]|nr:quinol dehydrogenase ferredoxin subunit NapH [bacterium]
MGSWTVASRLRDLRYLLPRRLVQAGVLVLLAGGNLWGWRVVQGNLSHSRLLDSVPLADPFAVLQLLAAGGMLTVDALLGGALVLVFYALVGGRTFCSWVCPMNPVTDLANRIGRNRSVARARGTVRMGRGTRYGVLGLALVLSAILGVPAFETVSPIGLLQRGLVFGAGGAWFAVAAVFLFDLLVHANGFCGHLCPLGAFYAAVSRFSLIRVRHDHVKCTRCNDCLCVCPEPQILELVGQASGSVLDGVCTNCGRCLEVCHDDALRFARRDAALSLDSGGS